MIHTRVLYVSLSPLKPPRCWLRGLALSGSVSTLIGRSPWQPKATSKAKGINITLDIGSLL